MIRVFSFLGMTGGFLIISPKLRESVLDGVAQVVAGLDKYSPYSYAGVALVLLGGLMMAFYRASAPR
jgi:hypothetical protein